MLDLKVREEDKSFWSDFGNRLMFFVIVILLIILVLTQFFRISQVSGWSMRNTIHDKDLVIVESAFKINKGDIVTARTSSYNIIKRVIADEGDKIVFVLSEGEPNVKLYIDEGNGFELMEESYIYRGKMTEEGFENQEKFERREYKLFRGDIAEVTDDYIIEVGENQYFLMGDNRDDSRDSRHYGLFDKESVFGKVIKRYEEGTPIYNFLEFFYNLKSNEYDNN